MPRGGARTRSGPPPDPNALHRDKDAGDWLSLPERREGDIPEWPLEDPKVAELEMWGELWTFAQAVVWEKNRQHGEVALYVRRFLEAAKPGASANLTSAVRQIADSLGLTIPGLLRNKWKIGGVQPETEQHDKPKGASSRERFKVVNGDG